MPTNSCQLIIIYRKLILLILKTEEKNMKIYMRIAGILMLPMLLSGCNTVEGFAKDLQWGGTKIEHTIKGQKTEEAKATEKKAPVKKHKAKKKKVVAESTY